MSEANEIIIYQPDESLKLDVRLEDETVWLSQAQMSELFQASKQNISLHISNIYKEGELEMDATVKEYLTVQTEGKRKVNRRISFYNLDVIISVGYRIKSIRGTQFRQWANKILKDYLLRGYSINQRFMQLENRIDRHNAQYPGVSIHRCTKVHDRFIVIDNDVYHIGHSLKDLGKKLFAFSKMQMLTGSELLSHLK